MDYDVLAIDTPENVLLEAEIAGFGTRCVAAVIDYLIMLVALAIIDYLYARAMARINANQTWAIASLTALQFLLITFYHLFFELLWNGQTPGKRIFGIRVVQSNGLPLTASSAIIRNLIRLFDFMPFLYGVGLVSMFATRQTQRLGDLAARTIVIREQRGVTLQNLKEDLSVTYHHISRTEPIPAYVHVESLSLDDRRDVVDYLQRRKNLRKREYVVGLLAERIARKMGNEAMIADFRSPTTAERFLEQVARAFELTEQAGS